MKDVMVGAAMSFLIVLCGAILFLVVLACCGCDGDTDDFAVYYTLDAEECAIDEIVDSDTGVVMSFCRLAGDPPIEDVDVARWKELQILWPRAKEMFPDRMDEVMEDGVRVWWVEPDDLVPDNGDAVEWWLWPKHFGYPTVPTTPEYGYGGMCLWSHGTDDGLNWLVVRIGHGGEFGILAHEMAHLFQPSLEHGTELDKVIWQLTHTSSDEFLCDGEKGITPACQYNARGVIVR